MDRPKLIGAAEVAERLCISRGTAYQIICELNEEVAARGKRTLAGKVDARFFESTFFTGEEEVSDGGQPE